MEMDEKRFLTLDRLLQTIGGILLTISVSVSGWSLLKIFEYEGRIIRLETEAHGMTDDVKEIKTTVKEIRAIREINKP